MDRISPDMPLIPDKRYFTIGEVSELCLVKPYVLRYWEQEFEQLRPMKRRGNRRYYQHHEVMLVRRIRELLYDKGFTISGARNRLLEMGHLPRPADEPDFAEDAALGPMAGGVSASVSHAALAAQQAKLSAQATGGHAAHRALQSSPSPSLDVAECWPELDALQALPASALVGLRAALLSIRDSLA